MQKKRRCKHSYIQSVRKYFDRKAVFSDETKYYRDPCEAKSGMKMKIRLRCGKTNVEKPYICFVTLAETTDHIMAYSHSTSSFDFYEYIYTVTPGISSYFFRLECDGLAYYYNKEKISPHPDLNEFYHFKIYADFLLPSWSKEAIYYQIFPDRFCNGNIKNDVSDQEYVYLGKTAKKINNWDAPIEKEDIRNFYGGDLQGILDQMDYLLHLGINALYLNPIFVSPSNHKYDVQDYEHIDPHLSYIANDEGNILEEDNLRNKYSARYINRTCLKENLIASNAFFQDFMKQIHNKGLKVVLDGVFNHCGAFNQWLDREKIYEAAGYPKGAYHIAESVYHSYFKWYEHNWPNNDAYDTWWGFDNHPKLYYENSKNLLNYILYIAKKWLSPPYLVDGWRLDVAADLGYTNEFNHLFWKKFRSAVKESNAEAIIIAEHYGDANPWLSGEEWDTVMNYDAFMDPLSYYLTGMEKHSDQYREDLLFNSDVLIESLTYHMANLSHQSLYTAMNQLSNHDHSRFLTRTNHMVCRMDVNHPEKAYEEVNYRIFEQAVCFQMCFVGCPAIYYGDEVGLAGFTDPDNRRTFPWGKENWELFHLHRQLIGIRKKYEILNHGSIKFVHHQRGFICFARFSHEDVLLIAMNSNPQHANICLCLHELPVIANDRFLVLFNNLRAVETEQFLICNENAELEMEMEKENVIILVKKT